MEKQIDQVCTHMFIMGHGKGLLRACLSASPENLGTPPPLNLTHDHLILPRSIFDFILVPKGAQISAGYLMFVPGMNDT